MKSTVSTLHDEDDQPRGEIAVVRDVTERLRTEEQLRQATQALQRRERQFAALVENSPDITARFDRALRHLYVSPGVERVSGRRAAEFIGRTNEELGAPAQVCAGWTAALEAVFATGQPARINFEIPDLAGEQRYFESRLVPEFAEDGSVESVLSFASDETERHQLDQARDAAALALREADLRKNEFLAMLSHELRTPLAPITHALEILRQAPEGPQREAARQALDRQVRQMVRLVDDLLDVNRIGQGKLQLRRATLDLHAVIELAVETSQPLIDAGGHRLELQLPPLGVLMVDGDLPRLTQVVANVLGNAAKYTPPTGRITLRAAREADTAVITVVDSGMGISGEMLPRIFDLFTQADTGTDRAQGGLGIGLALVKKLVDLHGGTVSAHSAGVGRGSCFTLTFPLLAEGEPELPTPASVIYAETPSPGNGGQRCVLIVDDNVDSAQMLAELLRMAGFQPHVAHDGARAVDLADECRPEVALLDIGLPGMDGREIARRIRSRPWGSQSLLIALSGWGSSVDHRQSLEAGFDHHLVKPVAPDALFGLLQQQPQRPSRGAGGEPMSAMAR